MTPAPTKTEQELGVLRKLAATGGIRMEDVCADARVPFLKYLVDQTGGKKLTANQVGRMKRAFERRVGCSQ